MDRIHTIGLIADTHGLLRPDVFTALDGVELILHAGDVGGDGILDELSLIAPVLAVAGNTDPPGEPRLMPSRVCDVAGTKIHVSHGHELGSPTPAALFARYTEPIIVYGHTHRQLVSRDGQRWAINPGAAGPRRFNLHPSVARLRMSGSSIDVEIVPLND
jgi:putative phosphoesterase